MGTEANGYQKALHRILRETENQIYTIIMYKQLYITICTKCDGSHPESLFAKITQMKRSLFLRVYYSWVLSHAVM